MVTEILAVAVVLAASLLQGFFGLGYAVFAVPLLSLVFGDPKQAVVFSMFTMMFQTAAMLPWSINKAPWREIPWLVVGLVLGTAAGVTTLRGVPSKWLLLMLGLVLILIAIWQFSGWMPRAEGNGAGRRLRAIGAGVVTGGVTALTSASGPPLLIYGTLKGWKPVTIKAFIQPVFMLAITFSLVGYALVGALTGKMVSLGLIAALPVILAASVSLRYADRVQTHRFERLFYGLIGLLGLVLLWRVASWAPPAIPLVKP